MNEPTPKPNHGEWRERALSELAVVIGGGTPSRNVPEFWNGSVPWATPTDITACKEMTLRRTKERISGTGLRFSSANLVPAGTVLMTSRATVGECRLAGIPVATNQGFKNLIPRDGVDGRFLMYQMMHHKHQYENFGIGTTFLEVSKRDTERFTVPFPVSFDAQRRIADLLSAVDEQVRSLSATVGKKAALRAGIVRKLILGDHQPTGWKFHGLAKDWEVSQFGAEFALQLGKMLSAVAKTGAGEVPYLGNRNVQWRRFELDSLETMHFNPRERLKYELRMGDLLICEGGEVGRAAVWRGAPFECFYQKAIHRARASSGRVLPEFALVMLELAAELGWFANYVVQTSIAHLPREKLLDFPIPVPSTDEQLACCSAIDAIDQEIKGDLSATAKLTKLGRGLRSALLEPKRC